MPISPSGGGYRPTLATPGDTAALTFHCRPRTFTPPHSRAAAWYAVEVAVVGGVVVAALWLLLGPDRSASGLALGALMGGAISTAIGVVTGAHRSSYLLWLQWHSFWELLRPQRGGWRFPRKARRLVLRCGAALFETGEACQVVPCPIEILAGPDSDLSRVDCGIRVTRLSATVCSVIVVVLPPET